MSLFARLIYRVRQFRLAIFGPWAPVPELSLSTFLSPALLALFRRMKPSEQAHSFAVLKRLQVTGKTDPNLLAAALLHDVGKICFPLSVWDRALIVVGKRFFQRRARRWGNGEPRGLRRPFVVAARHADWGADLVAAAGASAQTVELVRRHQDFSQTDDPLLTALQQADDFE
jgi:HD domain